MLQLRTKNASHRKVTVRRLSARACDTVQTPETPSERNPCEALFPCRWGEPLSKAQWIHLPCCTHAGLGATKGDGLRFDGSTCSHWEDLHINSESTVQLQPTGRTEHLEHLPCENSHRLRHRKVDSLGDQSRKNNPFWSMCCLPTLKLRTPNDMP